MTFSRVARRAVFLSAFLGLCGSARATYAGPANGPAAVRRATRSGHAFTGWAARPAEMAASQPARPSGNLALHSINRLGDAQVDIYGPDGALDRGALSALDRVMRCRRTGKVRSIDPRLYELLSRIYDHFGRPIDVISGYRNQRNHESKHYKAEAVDLHVPGVPDRTLRDYIESLDTGGMGIGLYPNAGFVHMDLRPGEPSYRWIDTSGHRYAGWDGGAAAARPTRHKAKTGT